MRNIFDQYNHPENRLTHALVSALHQDSKLLKRFVEWAAPTALVQAPFKIIEQSLPDEEEIEEETPERRGLPDAWIYNEEAASALLIESKIMCALSGDQIKRHLRTAKKRGFIRCSVLLLCLEAPRRKLFKEVFTKTWSEVYEWAVQQSGNSAWARFFAEYCEIAEVKMVQKEYLIEGKLTKPSIRRKVLGRGVDKFNELLLSVAKNMKNVFQIDPDVKPYVKVVQRHYKTQRSNAIVRRNGLAFFEPDGGVA